MKNQLPDGKIILLLNTQYERTNLLREKNQFINLPIVQYERTNLIYQLTANDKYDTYKRDPD